MNSTNCKENNKFDIVLNHAFNFSVVLKQTFDAKCPKFCEQLPPYVNAVAPTRLARQNRQARHRGVLFGAAPACLVWQGALLPYEGQLAAICSLVRPLHRGIFHAVQDIQCGPVWCCFAWRGSVSISRLPILAPALFVAHLDRMPKPRHKLDFKKSVN